MLPVLSTGKAGMNFLRKVNKMENQLKRLLEKLQIRPENRERASQILNEVEGMSIWEARELLGVCADILDGVTVSFSTPHSGNSAVPPTTINPAMPPKPSQTAQQRTDDALVDEIAKKLVERLSASVSCARIP